MCVSVCIYILYREAADLSSASLFGPCVGGCAPFWCTCIHRNAKTCNKNQTGGQAGGIGVGGGMLEPRHQSIGRFPKVPGKLPLFLLPAYLVCV